MQIGLLGARVVFGPGDLREAEIYIHGDRITKIVMAPWIGVAAKPRDTSIDLCGFMILPGFINAHDHLEFALFPRLGKPPYRNYIEWGHDIHRTFPEVIEKHRAVPKDVRMWWGGIRNLLCGVATVCHHNPLWPELTRKEFPTRVLQDYGWAHSVALGNDLPRARRRTPSGQPFVLHACEGIDEQMRQELGEIDRLAILDAETVLVHGLAINREGVELIQNRGASLILCPSSNAFLFGQTPEFIKFAGIENLALGSDSPLTAIGDLLDEIRFAISECGVPPERAFQMATIAPAGMLRLKNAEGTIHEMGVADIVAISDTGVDILERLGRISLHDIEFAMIAGRVHLASKRIRERLPEETIKELEPIWIDGTLRWLRAPVSELIKKTELVLGDGNIRLGDRQVRMPTFIEVQSAA